MTVTAPRKINRFEIQSGLGSGVQGMVYLARDTRLDRQVAIKTLAVHGTGVEDRKRVEVLLAEACIVGQLSHPNIVPLFDAGEDAGVPYLVFEYVQGQVLSDLLRDGATLPVERAIEIAIQILKAVGFAHKKRVVHRDLKPGNVMLAPDGSARVMDFGIAQLLSTQSPQDEGFMGTPAYTAPEFAGGAAYTPRADLFSIAMILYRMLTGRTVVSGDNAAEVLHKIATAPFAPPSQLNDEIDERLDDLLLKGLARNPEERFHTAGDMEEALSLYLRPQVDKAASAESSTATLDFLLRRMQHKSDFPALSATITAINQATASDDECADALSTCILRDFALTSKLLKIVNTASFGNFGGTISTVSRAVVIMGFDRVRSVAITLMLLEHLHNKADAARLKEELVAGYFSGILSRQLAASAGVRNAEEAFIYATFHNLGRLLTSFYFPEESRAIEKAIQQKGVDEMQASIQVLGVSFEDLGIGVAKSWNFPPRLIQSMRHMKEERIRRPKTEDEKLRALADFSANVCDAMRDIDDRRRDEKLERLIAKFGDALNVDSRLLGASIKQASAELSRDAIVLDLNIQGSAFLSGTAQGEKESEELLQHVIGPGTPAGAGTDDPVVSAADKRRSMLFDGIQDVSTTLVGDYKLNDMLRMILATMYRSMGFTRVLLFVRDSASNSLKSRFGLGAEVDKIIAGRLAIPLEDARDVFQASVSKGADVFIANVNAESVRKHIPEWYRRAFPAKAFALFPIVVKGTSIGLLYADSDVEGAMTFSTEELSMLKILRNQAVLAIKHHT